MSRSVILSDGDRALQLVLEGTAGIFLQNFEDDFTADEVTYSEPIDGEGRTPTRKRPQNVERTMTLGVSEYDEAPFWLLIDELQELVASVNRRGGTLEVDLGSGTAVTFDLVRSSLSGLPLRGSRQSVAQGIEVAYERLPYGRLEEITLFEDEEVEGPIDSLQIEGVPGHVDALGHLVLTDDSDQSRAFVEVGLTFEYEPGEPLQIDADAFELADTSGALATRAGSVSSQVARATISQDAVPVCRTGPLTHVGRKRVYARSFVEEAGVQLRLAWRVGDAPWTYEPWQLIEKLNAFVDLPIGVIDIGRVPAGVHSWEAQVEARVATGFADVDVDVITPFGADRYGRGSSASNEPSGALVLADDFNQTDGPYDGESMDVGGVVDSGGDSNDFEIASGSLERTAVNDTGGVGCWAVAPPVFTDVLASVQVFADELVMGTRQGLMLRYLDPNNYAIAYLTPLSDLDRTWQVSLLKRIGGANATVDTSPASASGQPIGYLIAGLVTATVRSDGRWTIQGPEGQMVAEGVDDDFAAGGDLDAGQCGPYDFHSSGDPCRRVMNGFRAYALPAPSPVIFAGGAAHFLHDAALRESVAGSGDDATFGRVPEFRGRHLKVPPATRADRKTLLTIRARRYNNAAGLEDAGLGDDLSATLKVTPRVLLTARP